MSVVQVSKKVNSPIDGDQEVFSHVIESLSLKAREKLALEFYDEVKEIRTRQAAEQFVKGYKHMSNATILELAAVSPRARKRILQLAREEAEKVLQAIEVLEAQEEDPEEEEDEEEAEE
ncbi:hypothetical protein [Metallosphaera sedula]|uniref:hypothetical protein n=1 Tax=Metallosphaera sedula TaxID=43687 RepID=UPI0020BE03B6|nr:hypothetical protein [Metallosphaera sedula]BBL48367.1 hypothetical protein MJ1HA_2489 [Metallosphaera sedula]